MQFLLKKKIFKGNYPLFLNRSFLFHIYVCVCIYLIVKDSSEGFWKTTMHLPHEKNKYRINRTYAQVFHCHYLMSVTCFRVLMQSPRTHPVNQMKPEHTLKSGMKPTDSHAKCLLSSRLETGACSTLFVDINCYFSRKNSIFWFLSVFREYFFFPHNKQREMFVFFLIS